MPPRARINCTRRRSQRSPPGVVGDGEAAEAQRQLAHEVVGPRLAEGDLHDFALELLAVHEVPDLPAGVERRVLEAEGDEVTSPFRVPRDDAVAEGAVLRLEDLAPRPVSRDQRRIAHVYPQKPVEPIALIEELTLKCCPMVSRMPR